MPYQIPCSGVIVLNYDNRDKDNNISTVVVKTHRGNYSYPKGKRKKGEEYLDTALRELEEETGIKQNMIDLLGDDGSSECYYIDELSNKGNPNVRYFVGVLKEQDHKFTFDEEELESVEWITIDELLKLEKLKQSRKDVFTQTLKAVKAVKI